MDEIARLCARLLVQGTLPRRDAPELQHPVLRAELEERLRHCGLALATSAYSDHVGVRLSEESGDASVLDAATNLGLGADACALLTILWARLALQKRTAEDTRSTPAAQPALLPEQQREAAEGYAPTVRFETLASEFGSRLGGRVRLKSLLGQLRRRGFVQYHRLDAIEAGPLLELGIDGERLVAFIRSRVLGQLLEARTSSETAAETRTVSVSLQAEKVLRALDENPEPATVAALARRTSLPRKELRRILKELRSAAHVEMTGQRSGARYRRVGPTAAGSGDSRTDSAGAS